jgi:branched-chain amino acid transport system permease protein
LDATFLTQILINSLFIGGIYACVAMGFSLIWGVANFLNLAQGEFVMLAGYMTYWLFKSLGVDPFLSITIVLPVMFCAGYLLERYILDRVIELNPFVTILFTFGLSILIANLGLRLFGPDVRVIMTSYSESNFTIAGVVIPLVRMVIFFFALAVAAGIYVFLKKTKIGNAIRAASQNRQSAVTMGIDIRHVFAVTFGIGVAITGVGGSLLSIVSPINPSMGLSFALKAFIISVLGGVGSLRGAFVGAIILGLAENFGSIIISSNFKNAIAAFILVFILVFMREGIFGRRGVE